MIIMPSTSESLWSARETEWLSFCKGKGAVRQLWKNLGNRRLKKYQTFTAPEGEIFSSWSECVEFMNSHKLQDPAGTAETEAPDEAVQGKLDVTESVSTSTASASTSTQSTRNDEKFALSPTSNFDESIWNIGDLMKVHITESLHKSSEKKSKDTHSEELPASSDKKWTDGHYNDNYETDDDADPEASKMVEVPIQIQNVVSVVGSSSTRGTKFKTDLSQFQQHRRGPEAGRSFKKTKQEENKSSENGRKSPVLNNQNENTMKSDPDTDQDSGKAKDSSLAMRAQDKEEEQNQSLVVKRRRTLREGVEHRTNKRAKTHLHRRRENLQAMKKILEYQRRGKGKRTREKSERRLLKPSANDEVRKRASISRRRSLRKPNDFGDTESRITTDSDMLISILMRKYMEQRKRKRTEA